MNKEKSERTPKFGWHIHGNPVKVSVQHWGQTLGRKNKSMIKIL